MRVSSLIKFLLVLFVIAGVPIAHGFGANVFVPTFDLTSWIDHDAKIETRANFDLSFEGGYKYQAKAAFEYYNIDVEQNPTQALIFDGASASLRDIFGFLDLNYFIGYYQVLGQGKYYKGHLYHRENGFEYEGFYPLSGTGIDLTGHFTKTIRTDLYAYQRTGSEYINSADLVVALGSDKTKFDLYTGISDQVFRAGTQFVFSGNEIEFSVTTGTLTISGDTQFNFDDFYLLTEEWFKMNRWNLILSVFTRPLISYNYVLREYADTNESNDIDFNFNLSFTPEKGNPTLGGEFLVKSNSVEDLGISLSPYVSIYTSGLVWKVKLDFNVLTQSSDFFGIYLNLQSSF